MARDCAFLVLRDIFIRHSAVLSLTAVLLRKVAKYNKAARLFIPCNASHTETILSTGITVGKIVCMNVFAVKSDKQNLRTKLSRGFHVLVWINGEEVTRKHHIEHIFKYHQT